MEFHMILIQSLAGQVHPVDKKDKTLSVLPIATESLSEKEFTIAVGDSSNTSLEPLLGYYSKSNASLRCCCFCVHKDNITGNLL